MILQDGDQGQQPSRYDSKGARGPGDKQSKLDIYKQIQHASSGLYETICQKWRCGVHEKHAVHLCSHWGLRRCAATGPVSFTVVITPNNNDGHECLPHLKIEVQHSQCQVTAVTANTGPMDRSKDPSAAFSQNRMTPVVDSTLRDTTVDRFTSSLEKSVHEWIPETKQLKRQKLERRPQFGMLHPNIPIEDLQLNGSSAENNATDRAQDHSTDLQCVSDHCIHFKKQHQCCSEETYLGHLADHCIQRFYLQPTGEGVNAEYLSLADLIRKASEKSTLERFPLSSTMSLAHSIADAVLQFYSSPWLPERWESNNIHFFGIEGPEYNLKLAKFSSLYVTLNFGGESKGKAVAGPNRKALGMPTPNASTAHMFDGEVRNERLFCLGIVLLELGYAKPWGLLRSNMMGRPHMREKSDYVVADRLAKELLPQVGLGYSRIIRKCIACDFGLGESDLNDDELQRKFVEDVIEELQMIDQGLATL